MLPIDRIKKIILNPKEEWPVIAAETTTPKELYLKYILLLAAIPAVASFLGMTFVGISLPFIGNIKSTFSGGLSAAIVQYALSLGMVWVLALILDALAPKFGAEVNFNQSLKLVAYSMTPGYVAGVLHVIPSLGILASLASIYGLYLLFLGLPVLKKSAPEQTTPYFWVTVACAVGAAIVMGLIVAAFGPGRGSSAVTFNGRPTSELEAQTSRLLKSTEELTREMEKKIRESGVQK